MAGQAKIDIKEVQQKGATLQQKADDMFATLQKAQEVIKNTEASFDSPEGRAMREQFAEYSRSFSNFKQDVDEFGRFTKQYAGNLDDLQKKMAANARRLPSVK